MQQYWRCCYRFFAFLADPAFVGATVEVVLAELRAKEEICRCADHYMDKAGGWGPLLEISAFAAERCGDDELALFYAEKGVDWYAPAKPLRAAACRMVLGRLARKREEHGLAERHWQLAAEEAIALKDPLLVFRICMEWDPG